ncbi:MAG: radical SAM protein [Alphaproteobacteria bacterium]|nr:radical SAM protein [Alphaproteobacteria bacterium]MBV9370822.1 radical SAM protein [Alphaproteobacteria bacterium]MBV9900098.1 radical SAM protein [Alphaproteobacteria bacterium]
MSSLSLYVHFPFCRQKCHFCDWVQRVPKQDLLREAGDSKRRSYVDALSHELRERGMRLTAEGYRPTVIYWGGGTSTSMSGDEVAAIVETMRDGFDLSEVREWTIEGSPDTVSPESLAHYRALGFNRFSVGVQSFQDGRLRKLGRRHNSDQGRDAIRAARAAGFETVSLDIMCGFADETPEETDANVAAAVDLHPEHLSVYTFRPTEGTVIRRSIDHHQVKLEVARQLASYQRASKALVRAGYAEYGVGYFGQPAENVTAMFQLRSDVAGFGSGAVSIMDGTYLGHTSGLLDRYIDDPLHHDFEQSLMAPGVALSLLRSGLSIHGGIAADDWERRIGESLAESLRRPEIARLLAMLDVTGAVELSEERIALRPEKAALVIIGLMNQAMLASSATQ